jgi:hypothetical protein
MSRPDTSIYQGIQPIHIPNPLDEATKLVSLQDMMQQSRLRNEQLLDAQKKRQHDERVASIIAGTDPNEPDRNSPNHPIGALRKAGLFDDAKKIQDQLREAETLDVTLHEKELNQVKETAGIQAQYGQAILGIPEGSRRQGYGQFYSTLNQAGHAKALDLPDPSTFQTEEDVTKWARSHRDAGMQADKLATLIDNEAKNSQAAKQNTALNRGKIVEKPVGGESHDFGYDEATNDWTKDLGLHIEKPSTEMSDFRQSGYMDTWAEKHGKTWQELSQAERGQAFIDFKKESAKPQADDDLTRYLKMQADAKGRPLTPAEQIAFTEKFRTLGPVAVGEIRARENAPPDLDYVTHTTASGRDYIDASSVKPASLNKLQQQAGDLAQQTGKPLPVLTAKDAAAQKDIDAARTMQADMLTQLENKLPRDAAGRILQGPANTLRAWAQTDADLAAYNAFRTAAIRTLRATAGSGGLRINQQEIELAVNNDIPRITDTIAVARAKVRNIVKLLDAAEAPYYNVGQGRNQAPASLDNALDKAFGKKPQ